MRFTQLSGARPGPDLEQMMAAYGDSLLRLCTLYLKDRHLAQDAVQETFVRAWMKYDSFRAEASEKTWLTRIAINICKDALRRKAFSERPADDALPDLPDETPGPEDAALRRDANRRLIAAIQNLEPIYREAVLLHYYSGLKTRDIAAMLHTPEGTVKTRLMRARDRLKSLLEEERT
jgi:RNA polymerase sigma-70 factor (ECF subfamily)